MSSPPQFASAPTILLLANLNGYARAFRSHSDAEMAAFIDRFYRIAGVTCPQEWYHILC